MTMKIYGRTQANGWRLTVTDNVPAYWGPIQNPRFHAKNPFVVLIERRRWFRWRMRIRLHVPTLDDAMRAMQSNYRHAKAFGRSLP